MMHLNWVTELFVLTFPQENFLQLKDGCMFDDLQKYDLCNDTFQYLSNFYLTTVK